MIDYSRDFIKAYPIRFAGYGFGVGEAIRGLATPTLVRGLYTIGTGFIFARTLYKPFQVSKNTQSPVKIVLWTGDTFVYEVIASATVPVFLVTIVKSAVNTGMQSKSFAGASRLWAPALVSLSLMPFVIPFTDAALDMFMNATVRQMYS